MRLLDGILGLRWKAVRLLTPRRTVHSRGLSFTLPCDNWITDFRFQTYNTKEPETLDWIDQGMRDGDIFFDVGANIGLYSLYAAFRHPRSQVVALEPEYANLHLLRDNVAANGLCERIRIYGLALSDRQGLSFLHVQDLTPGAALHTESRERLEVTKSAKPVVLREGTMALRLDDFCAMSGLTPNCVKIDVDGTEAEVLEGAEKTLAQPALRSVIIEVAQACAARCGARLGAAGLGKSYDQAIEEGCRVQIWERR